MSVRSAGLGGAGAALSGDASSTFLNPAGLATIRNIAIEGAAQRYPDGSLEGLAAGGFRLFQFDLGGGVHYLRFSDTSAIKDNLQWTASGVYRFGFLAARWHPQVRLPGGLRGGRCAASATTNAGVGIHVFDLMTLAFAIRNMGSWRVTGGPLLLPAEQARRVCVQFRRSAGDSAPVDDAGGRLADRAARRTLIGLEAGAVVSKVGIVGRMGYGAAPEGAGQKKVSLGGGLVLSRFNIDYAWQRRTRLGREVHRLGLRFTL